MHGVFLTGRDMEKPQPILADKRLAHRVIEHGFIKPADSTCKFPCAGQQAGEGGFDRWLNFPALIEHNTTASQCRRHSLLSA